MGLRGLEGLKVVSAVPFPGERGKNMHDMILRLSFSAYFSADLTVCWVFSQPKSYEGDVFPVRMHLNASVC